MGKSNNYERNYDEHEFLEFEDAFYRQNGMKILFDILCIKEENAIVKRVEKNGELKFYSERLKRMDSISPPEDKRSSGGRKNGKPESNDNGKGGNTQ